jgi:two-component system sensor histidine kinase CpxA
MVAPAPRLFWRMALWIGAAIAAFVPLAIAVLVLIASRQLENYSATRHGSLGREAARVLAEGGRPALERWLRNEAPIPEGVSVFVLDGASRDILARPVPAAYADFIARYVVADRESPAANYQPIRLAPQLIGPDGDRYAFLVMPRGIDLWGSPAALAGVALAALLVIGTIAWLIARAFTRPIRELQLAARTIASGHVEARVPAAISTRRDELGTLAADFNSMASRIEALLASREQLMRELSHELRSPLTRLQAALALAGARQPLAAGDRERIELEISRMNRVIGDLLRYSRLDAAAEIARHLVRIDALLGELVRDEDVEAAARGCRLELAADRDLAVVGDPQLLRSGLENIVRNAIRFAPRGTTVEIEARRADGHVRIVTRDRGPGVPADQLERIFEPYVRVASAGTDAGGTGLGLAIARRVFALHDGDVRAAAREGGGLEVTVALPAAEMS